MLPRRLLLVQLAALVAFSAEAACRFIVIASMQRSGSSELSSELGRASTRLFDGREFFLSPQLTKQNVTLCGQPVSPKWFAAHPVQALERERAACCEKAVPPQPCKGMVLKLFDVHLDTNARSTICGQDVDCLSRLWYGRKGYLPLASAEKVLRHPETCTLVLERTDVDAQWCSLKTALENRQFGFRGTHVHPKCESSAPMSFVGQHSAWYQWLRNASGSRIQPVLELPFSSIVGSDRQMVLQMTLAQLRGLPRLRAGAAHRQEQTVVRGPHQFLAEQRELWESSCESGRRRRVAQWRLRGREALLARRPGPLQVAVGCSPQHHFLLSALVNSLRLQSSPVAVHVFVLRGDRRPSLPAWGRQRANVSVTYHSFGAEDWADEPEIRTIGYAGLRTDAYMSSPYNWIKFHLDLYLFTTHAEDTRDAVLWLDSDTLIVARDLEAVRRTKPRAPVTAPYTVRRPLPCMAPSKTDVCSRRAGSLKRWTTSCARTSTTPSWKPQRR